MSNEVLKTTLALTAIGALSAYAFVPRVAKEIKDRDGWTCQITGQKASDGFRMEASHITDGEYNTDPNNGVCLSLMGHFIDHVNKLKATNNMQLQNYHYASCKLIIQRALGLGLRYPSYYDSGQANRASDNRMFVEEVKRHEVDFKL